MNLRYISDVNAGCVGGDNASRVVTVDVVVVARPQDDDLTLMAQQALLLGEHVQEMRSPLVMAKAAYALTLFAPRDEYTVQAVQRLNGMKRTNIEGQSVRQAGSQSGSQAGRQTIRQSGRQSVCLSVSQSSSQSVRQSISRSISQSGRQSASQSVSQSVGQSGGQPHLVSQSRFVSQFSRFQSVDLSA